MCTFVTDGSVNLACTKYKHNPISPKYSIFCSPTCSMQPRPPFFGSLSPQHESKERGHGVWGRLLRPTLPPTANSWTKTTNPNPTLCGSSPSSIQAVSMRTANEHKPESHPVNSSVLLPRLEAARQTSRPEPETFYADIIIRVHVPMQYCFSGVLVYGPSIYHSKFRYMAYGHDARLHRSLPRPPPQRKIRASIVIGSWRTSGV